MSRKMTSAEFMRKEFDKEVKKAMILLFNGTGPVNEITTEKRILRAYNIAEMRAALREEQQGGGE